jgi:hypothetical protein
MDNRDNNFCQLNEEFDKKSCFALQLSAGLSAGININEHKHLFKFSLFGSTMSRLDFIL